MKLFFRKTGKGKALIIIHGMYGMSDNWLSIGKFLAKENEVFLLDLRNHGQSPHSPDNKYSDSCGDIYEFMQENSIEKASFLGHSMGGKVAMQFAADNPKLVEKLIIVDISPAKYEKKDVPGDFSHRELLKAMQKVDFSVVKSRNDAVSQLNGVIKIERMQKFLMKNIKKTKENTFSWIFNVEALLNNLDNIAGEVDFHNKKIKIPSLLIKGGNSNYVKEKDIDLIKSTFNHIQINTIKNAGHWVHADKTREFTDIVNEFLI